MHKNDWSDKLKGREYSKNLELDGSIILEWMLGQ